MPDWAVWAVAGGWIVWPCCGIGPNGAAQRDDVDMAVQPGQMPSEVRSVIVVECFFLLDEFLISVLND